MGHMLSDWSVIGSVALFLIAAGWALWTVVRAFARIVGLDR